MEKLDIPVLSPTVLTTQHVRDGEENRKELDCFLPAWSWHIILFICHVFSILIGTRECEWRAAERMNRSKGERGNRRGKQEQCVIISEVVVGGLTKLELRPHLHFLPQTTLPLHSQGRLPLSPFPSLYVSVSHNYTQTHMYAHTYLQT